MSATPAKASAIVAVVVAMALWGSSFIGLKIAFVDIPPLWVIWARMAIGSAIFLAAWRWRGRCDYRAGDWKYLLGLSVCEPCLYFLCEALALQYTSAAQAGMITALLPLMVAVGAFVFLRERIGRAALFGFLIAVLGSVWLSVSGSADAQAPAPLLGNFLEFLAMLCAVGYILTLKHLSTRYSAFLLTALQSFVGGVFFLPLAAFSAPLPTAVGSASLLAVAYLGVFVTVGAYGLYNYSVSHLPANQASAFVNLIPMFTLLFATLLLGERLNGEQMLGAALVFVGVALSQWQGKRSEPLDGVLD